MQILRLASLTQNDSIVIIEDNGIVESRMTVSIMGNDGIVATGRCKRLGKVKICESAVLYLHLTNSLPGDF
jgi:hypothetical protein